jgi:hypothetical protein
MAPTPQASRRTPPRPPRCAPPRPPRCTRPRLPRCRQPLPSRHTPTLPRKSLCPRSRPTIDPRSIMQSFRVFCRVSRPCTFESIFTNMHGFTSCRHLRAATVCHIETGVQRSSRPQRWVKCYSSIHLGCVLLRQMHGSRLRMHVTIGLVYQQTVHSIIYLQHKAVKTSYERTPKGLSSNMCSMCSVHEA